MDDLDVTGENETSTQQNDGHSGITLVLPSLRALQAANAGKKSKTKQVDDQRPKIPRPIKLKPLKEVLTKLITQIKKKDDYAFFIHPVNPAQVPGYTDIITHPMDLGTITTKVTRGKYRSLDEFTADFRLVTTNAKTFNPPGSIYYNEADRLEVWGLEHITRASAHVIEYETDWNIDIEQDEDGSTSQQPVNIDDEVSTPRDLDGSMATGSRAQSMTPVPGQAPMLGQGKRSTRGPYKKHTQTPLSEGLDAEGKMPGVKDGVGVFPPGSDWAELMIALKIKGKRYKTKKERLRFEKEGPPYQTDGSLDYAEMEDPFSVLNVFVREPCTRPQVTPLYPPAHTTISAPIIMIDGTPSHSQSRIHVPMPITIPPHRPSPVLSTLSSAPPQPPVIATTSATPARPLKRRRHWTIVRNAPVRSRAKDKDVDTSVDDAKTAWKVARDPGPADYGTFATLQGELTASAIPGTSTGIGTAGTNAADYMYGNDQRLFATIRSTIEHRAVRPKLETPDQPKHEGEDAETFWTDERAEEAWDYLRDVVYGGVDGYAYVRSLAEFVAPSVYLDDARKDEPQVVSRENGDAVHPLGVSVARYVEDNLVDMVTRGRHGWLRDVLVPCSTIAMDPACATLCGDGPLTPFHVRLASLPGAPRAVALFQKWYDEQLDMASLIRVPDELAKESILEGSTEGSEHARIEHALAWSVEVFEELGKRLVKNEDEDALQKVKEEAVEDVYVAEEDASAMDVDAKSEPDSKPDVEPTRSKFELAEDPLLKRLRLNLLALAKRAPLDRIAKLPVELVPEHIRGIVPIA